MNRFHLDPKAKEKLRREKERLEGRLLQIHHALRLIGSCNPQLDPVTRSKGFAR